MYISKTNRIRKDLQNNYQLLKKNYMYVIVYLKENIYIYILEISLTHKIHISYLFF